MKEPTFTLSFINWAGSDTGDMSGQVYRAVAEDSVDAMFIACDTATVFANRAMASLLGADGPEALVGGDASAWVVEAEREGFLRRVHGGQGGAPGPRVEELSLRRVDGGVRRVEASVSPIDYNGRPANLFICRDVTERKASEMRSAEKERMKAQLIYTATHDLKNPLTSIKGYVELLQAQLGRESHNPQIGQMLGVVARSTERLDALINDLLEVLRIIDGRIELTMAEHNVAEFLRQVAEETSPALSRRRQSLDVESEVGSLVFGQRLLQVLKNLVDNSSKFSPEGSIILLRVEKTGGAARFSVADEGIGLGPGDVPKLFKPFPGIVKPGSYDGTGLGLAICKGIVELHGGEIWAESPGAGRGSTFYFTIPLNLQTSLKPAH
jgi:PAS domain S-box-containing protein